jgi:hypothetical protein
MVKSFRQDSRSLFVFKKKRTLTHIWGGGKIPLQAAQNQLAGCMRPANREQVTPVLNIFLYRPPEGQKGSHSVRCSNQNKFIHFLLPHN